MSLKQWSLDQNAHVKKVYRNILNRVHKTSIITPRDQRIVYTNGKMKAKGSMFNLTRS